MTKKEILEKLSSKNEDDRVMAIYAIIENNLTSLIPNLVELMYQDERRIVRESIVEALKSLDIKDYYHLIAKFFESPDAYLRNCAIEIFGSKGEDSVAFLTSIMDHSNPEVRKLILDSLVATGSPYAVPAIKAGLEDPAINVKITAVEYLGELGDASENKKVLQILRETEEPMLKIACLQTLTVTSESDFVDEILNSFDLKNIPAFYKPSIFKLIAEKGSAKHLNILLDYLNNKNHSFMKDIASAMLELVIRENIDTLPADKLKFIKEYISNSDYPADIRILFLQLLREVEFSDKFEFFQDIMEREKNSEVLMLVLEIMYEIDKEKTLNVIEKKIKFADADIKNILMEFKESLGE